MGRDTQMIEYLVERAYKRDEMRRQMRREVLETVAALFSVVLIGWVLFLAAHAL